MKEIKWYHFWNPESGLLGGYLCGAVLIALTLVIATMSKLLALL